MRNILLILVILFYSLFAFAQETSQGDSSVVNERGTQKILHSNPLPFSKEERKGKSRKDQEARHELEMEFAVEDLLKLGFRLFSKMKTLLTAPKLGLELSSSS